MKTAFQGVLSVKLILSRHNQSNRKFGAFLKHLLIWDAWVKIGYSGAEIGYSDAILWYSGAKIGYAGELA